jgi:hypothetical protein
LWLQQTAGHKNNIAKPAMQQLKPASKIQKIITNPAWALVAAFGTYFCMYGFRKPYTAATYADVAFFGINYKFLLIIAQTIGYVIAKWVGIKIVSEIKPTQRIRACCCFSALFPALTTSSACC